MPTTVVPVTIVNTTPNVSILPTNVTYEQFLNSLGDYVYWTQLVYIWSDVMMQLQGVPQFTHYDANGTQRFIYLTPTIDPFQAQNALFFDTKNYKIVIDGNSAVNLNLLPNVYLQLTFYGERLAKGEYLDLNGVNNFIDLQRTLGLPQIFDGYNEILY